LTFLTKSGNISGITKRPYFPNTEKKIEKKIEKKAWFLTPNQSLRKDSNKNGRST